MATRMIAIPLWFVSTWLAYGLVAYFLGIPDSGGAVIGALIAGLVYLDPTGAFWGPRQRRGSAVPRQAATTTR
jgi:hypothetical protein